MKNDYSERIINLIIALSKNEVPCYVTRLYDGYKVIFPWCDGDVIAHSGMLGWGEYGVESFGFPWDNGDVTLLEVAEAVDLITNLYKG